MDAQSLPGATHPATDNLRGLKIRAAILAWLALSKCAAEGETQCLHDRTGCPVCACVFVPGGGGTCCSATVFKCGEEGGNGSNFCTHSDVASRDRRD